MTLLDEWRSGRGLPGTLVIDGHTHPYRWKTGFRTPEDAASEMLRQMDSYCVDVSCLMGGGYMHNGADYRIGNDFLLECAKVSPDRLIPFAHVNPHAGLDVIAVDLDRMVDAGVHAIKLLNAYQAYPGDGENLLAVYEYAQSHNMLLLNHHWSEAEIRDLAPAFPDLIMIRGHGGASSIAQEYPNLYDNTWSLHPMARIERGVQAYGPEKILFGSDAVVNDPAVGIGLIVYADIPDEYKRAILGLNMAKLLDRVGALPTGLKHWLN